VRPEQLVCAARVRFLAAAVSPSPHCLRGCDTLKAQNPPPPARLQLYVILPLLIKSFSFKLTNVTITQPFEDGVGELCLQRMCLDRVVVPPGMGSRPFRRPHRDCCQTAGRVSSVDRSTYGRSRMGRSELQMNRASGIGRRGLTIISSLLSSLPPSARNGRLWLWAMSSALPSPTFWEHSHSACSFILVELPLIEAPKYTLPSCSQLPPSSFCSSPYRASQQSLARR